MALMAQIKPTNKYIKRQHQDCTSIYCTTKYSSTSGFLGDSLKQKP